MLESRLLALWAKTDRHDPVPGRYHPALFHMIDVGNVAAVLLGVDGPQRLRDSLSRMLGADDPASVGRWIPLIAAFHDLGKISSPFQCQAPMQRARLEALGIPLVTDAIPREVRHQHFSVVALRDEVLPLLPGVVPLRQIVIDALGGHHGQFADDLVLGRAAAFNRVRESEELHRLRMTARDRVFEVFPVDPTEQWCAYPTRCLLLRLYSPASSSWRTGWGRTKRSSIVNHS